MRVKFNYFIIVDEHDKPMSLDAEHGQLCYCDDMRWKGDVFPVKIITKQEAVKQIAITKKNRKKLGFNVGKYYLMPVETHPKRS